jgi:hypothetical protein
MKYTSEGEVFECLTAAGKKTEDRNKLPPVVSAVPVVQK